MQSDKSGVIELFSSFLVSNWKAAMYNFFVIFKEESPLNMALLVSDYKRLACLLLVCFVKLHNATHSKRTASRKVNNKG